MRQDHSPFAALLACVLTCLVVYALQAEPADKVARVAYVGGETAALSLPAFEAFRKRLRELGWIEGQNLVLDQYWADGNFDRFPELMRAALAGRPDVLITSSTPGPPR